MFSIVQLLIISAVAFMAQSAPLSENDDCESSRAKILESADSRTELQKHTVHLYCVANSLRNTVGNNRTAVQGVQLPNISIYNATWNKIFHHFSNECKNFITTLSLKHWLQEYLFNQTNATVLSQHIGPLHSMLVYLQTMAKIWDDIEFNVRSNSCVRLTATQYKMMYYVQYDDPSLQQSLTNEADKWTEEEYYKKHLNSVPSICNCNILYPSLD